MSAAPSDAHRSTAPVIGHEPVPFDTVFEQEIERIKTARKGKENAVDAASYVKKSLVGLAFSGGGVRSATFNLGILQALAKKSICCTKSIIFPWFRAVGKPALVRL